MHREILLSILVVVGIAARASATPVTLATYALTGTIDDVAVNFSVPSFVPEDLGGALGLKDTFLIDDVSSDALLDTPPGPYQRHVANTRYCAPGGCLTNRFSYEETIDGPVGSMDFGHDLTIRLDTPLDILAMIGVADAFTYREVLLVDGVRTEVTGTLTLTDIAPGAFLIDTVPEDAGMAIAVPVPEPASLALLAIGLLTVRRRH